MNLRFDASSVNDEQLEALETALNQSATPALVDAEGNKTILPESVYDMLMHLLSMMKQKRSIVMMPEDETFTTQAAANFLGISRQYFVDLLEDGCIPFHKVGTHRKVYFSDLRSYAKERDKNRRQSMDELFDQVEQEGLYDASYTGDDS